jgi:hypothetical protein
MEMGQSIFADIPVDDMKNHFPHLLKYWKRMLNKITKLIEEER